jgi:hypothetical protein
MLARTVSSILLQRGIERWQDDTKEHLRKELRECRMRIENVDRSGGALEARLAVFRAHKHMGHGHGRDRSNLPVSGCLIISDNVRNGQAVASSG